MISYRDIGADIVRAGQGPATRRSGTRGRSVGEGATGDRPSESRHPTQSVVAFQGKSSPFTTDSAVSCDDGHAFFQQHRQHPTQQGRISDVVHEEFVKAEDFGFARLRPGKAGGGIC